MELFCLQWMQRSRKRHVRRALHCGAMHSPIYFDARWCGQHGIGRFASELQQRVPGIIPLPIAGGKLSVMNPLASSLALAGKRRGCFFSPGFNPPLRSPLPVAFTIHDLIHLKVPEESSFVRRLYYRTVVRPAALRAWRVFTISEYSRQDIAEWSGLPESAIHVIGVGVSPTFVPQGRRHQMDMPYFLHVGRRAGHKNIPALLKAFANSGASRRAMLVFTGTPDTPTAATALSLGIADRVTFAGNLTDEKLAELYRGATGLLFPSLYEGFGLPVIESMACGTPVVTSNLTATREAAGPDNALLVNPRDVDALGYSILRLLDDAAMRAQLSQRGLERAKEFTWAGVAARVSAVLNEGT